MGDIGKNVKKAKVEAFQATFEAPKARVLVVDDNEMNLSVAKGILRPYKIAVTCVDSGAEAMAVFHKDTYNLIFMDHMMPVMDGVETMQQLREMPRGKDAIIIALTANALSGAGAEYKALGFQDFLAKPIEPKEMDDLLKQYLPDNLIYDPKGIQADAAATASEEMILEFAPQGDDDESLESDESALGRLEKIAGLNVKKGLTYCMDSEEFYLDMVRTFVEGSKMQILEKACQKKDWENYRITVHAVKSNSLTIGAENLSEEAKSLEMALKENHPEFVEENHGTFCGKYQDFLDACKVCLI